MVDMLQKGEVIIDVQQDKSHYRAVPGAVRAGPSFEGPIGELRLLWILLAELLRRRFTTSAIGGGPPLLP